MNFTKDDLKLINKMVSRELENINTVHCVIELVNLKEQLTLTDVSNQRELLIAFFMHFRDKGEQNIGTTIEEFVEDYLRNL